VARLWERTPLSFGVELYPFTWHDFADQLVPSRNSIGTWRAMRGS